jgi:hypothetical protein
MGIWRATALASAELSDLRTVYDKLGSAGSPDDPGRSSAIKPADLAVPEGKFGVLVVRRPDRALPVLTKWFGDSLIGPAKAVSGASDIRATLRIDENSLLHVEGKAKSLDGEDGKRLAETLRTFLVPLGDLPSVEVTDLTPSGGAVEIYIRWRAPWTEQN